MARRREGREIDNGLARALSMRGGIEPFIVMEVMREANAREARGERVIHMEVGQPSTPAPATALAAARVALSGDRLGYTDALGLPALRARIAAHYREAHDFDLDPARVIVTAGSSAGFVLAFLALFDAGDEVALPAPGYPCYRHILTALGCRPRLVETTAETGWNVDPALVARADDAGGLAGLLVASPNNPTGTVLSRAALSELADCCRDRGISLVSDEIYHGLTYGGAATSALAVSDQAIVINSFSKYFSMTGWRIGWMVVPESLVLPLERLAQNLYISPPTLSQIAALAAFDGTAELEDHKRAYAVNRGVLLAELPAAGLTRLLPADGAFYIYADVGDLTTDSLSFARRMLEECGVAATPGLDFDPARGHRYLRFSYARSTADIREGAARLADWLPRQFAHRQP